MKIAISYGSPNSFDVGIDKSQGWPDKIVLRYFTGKKYFLIEVMLNSVVVT